MATTREAIVEALRDALAPLPYVDAFWEGGAVAWGRVDEWSDLDLQVLADPAKLEEVSRTIEEALAGVSKIRARYVVQRPASEKIHQTFYRLEGTSPFLLVDLAILEPSTPDKLLDPEIHGRNLVYFDKTGATAAPPLDRAELEHAMRTRLGRLRERTEMFHVFVEKDLRRRHPLEALDAYRSLVLGALLEVLRMKHTPLHYEFGTKYVHQELPGDVVRRLESLSFVRDAEDLRVKYAEALRWFRETAAELG